MLTPMTIPASGQMKMHVGPVLEGSKHTLIRCSSIQSAELRTQILDSAIYLLAL